MPVLYLFQGWLPDGGLGLAFRPASLTDGQWWPGVLTAMFLHAGWVHVSMNAVGALAFAPPVARLGSGLRGALGFLLFYIVCGVVAALGYGLIHLESQDIMVGASGAVFGLLGAAIRLLGRRDGTLRPLTDRRTLTTATALMVVNALIGLIGFVPGGEAAGIAWEAHAFGFLFGFLTIGLWTRLFGPPRPAFDSTGDLRDPQA
ncbi:rhomboid family intramembrane serine protease [Brevundimonas lenta]|uniref:Membrane associated rhomboid family serine protease n=1 Tax=Brevundimonas lenta TaxID=424796 RepID=A0A7W6JGL4_9CAUL|nr:rhomboid family intramembrane serine protease [Brevundimonas lenta]MBB4083773.1 membrane associated rhomboid family serine protease [Brevundimonas lenta]